MVDQGVAFELRSKPLTTSGLLMIPSQAEACAHIRRPSLHQSTKKITRKLILTSTSWVILYPCNCICMGCMHAWVKQKIKAIFYKYSSELKDGIVFLW